MPRNPPPPKGVIEPFEPNKSPVAYRCLGMLYVPIPEEENLRMDIEELEQDISVLTENIRRKEREVHKHIREAEELIATNLEPLQELKREFEDARFNWRRFPLAREREDLKIDLELAKANLKNSIPTRNSDELNRIIQQIKAKQAKNKEAIRNLDLRKEDYFRRFGTEYSKLLRVASFLVHYDEMNQRGFELPKEITQRVKAFTKPYRIHHMKKNLLPIANQFKINSFSATVRECNAFYIGLAKLQLQRVQSIRQLEADKAALVRLQQQRSHRAEPTKSSHARGAGTPYRVATYTVRR